MRTPGGSAGTTGAGASGDASCGSGCRSVSGSLSWRSRWASAPKVSEIRCNSASHCAPSTAVSYSGSQRAASAAISGRTSAASASRRSRTDAVSSTPARWCSTCAAKYSRYCAFCNKLASILPSRPLSSTTRSNVSSSRSNVDSASQTMNRQRVSSPSRGRATTQLLCGQSVFRAQMFSR